MRDHTMRVPETRSRNQRKQNGALIDVEEAVAIHSHCRNVAAAATTSGVLLSNAAKPKEKRTTVH